MIKYIIINLIFAFSSVTHAAVFERHEIDPENKFTAEEKEESISLMTCQIDENFDEYLEFLIEAALPRVSGEIQELVRPAIDLNGERIQIGDEVDSTDLFHTRVQVPIVEAKKLPIGFGYYTEPKNYFFQYHSFERRGELVKKWIDELFEIDNDDLQSWLRDVVEHKNLKEKTTSSEFDTWSYEDQASSPLTKALGVMHKSMFAELWYEYTLAATVKPSDNYKEWLLERFEARLDIIDPKTPAHQSLLDLNRSVSSFGSYYYIISQKTHQDTMTLANIYFENRSDMPSDFERLVADERYTEGKNYILKSSDKFSDFIKAFRSSKDPYNVMKYAHRTDSSSAYHRVISWDENYVFSIRFAEQKCTAIVEEEEAAQEEESDSEEDEEEAAQEEESDSEEDEEEAVEEEESDSEEDEEEAAQEEESDSEEDEEEAAQEEESDSEEGEEEAAQEEESDSEDDDEEIVEQ